MGLHLQHPYSHKNHNIHLYDNHDGYELLNVAHNKISEQQVKKFNMVTQSAVCLQKNNKDKNLDHSKCNFCHKTTPEFQSLSDISLKLMLPLSPHKGYFKIHTYYAQMIMILFSI